MDGGIKHSTREESWRTWKAKCSAGLCGPEVEAELRRFGQARCAQYLQRYAARCGPRLAGRTTVDAENGWHWLETHAATASNRQGKRYKDWLFERADSTTDWLAAMEAGASLLMRDAAREVLRREYSPAWMSSLQQPIADGGESALTLEDLLPDGLEPTDAAAEREWQALALQHARDILPRLNERECIVIWARGEGLSLNDHRLGTRARTSASILYKTYHATVETLCGELKARYRGEPPAQLCHLARLILQELHNLAARKLFSQKTMDAFFKGI